MWIKTSLKKIDMSVNGSVTPDKRGIHTNRPFVISNDVKAKIREHINLCPRIPSHYTRARSNKMYLEEGLNISTLNIPVVW